MITLTYVLMDNFCPCYSTIHNLVLFILSYFLWNQTSRRQGRIEKYLITLVAPFLSFGLDFLFLVDLQKVKNCMYLQRINDLRIGVEDSLSPSPNRNKNPLLSISIILTLLNLPQKWVGSLFIQTISNFPNLWSNTSKIFDFINTKSRF